LTGIVRVILCSHVSDATASATDKTKELRGSVLDVLRQLLAGRHDDEVIALVTELVARNHELEILLGKLRESKNRGEHISTSQLDLFLNKLKSLADGDLAEANKKLEDTANKNGGRPELSKPPKQPPVRRPPPPGLRRVDNPIPVPASERPCPKCGKDRKCIAHETTPVIDLIPGEVIVRLDIREILGCDPCDAELQRAPMGDKVVSGGAYGSTLVADLIVGKYKKGLPLYRQGEALEHMGLSMPSSSMADQITWGTDLLRPIWRQLTAQVLGAIVMQLDATSLPVRDKDSPKGIVLGALWGYVGDATSVVYLYTSTGKKLGQREGEIGPQEFLAKRKGYVVADASNLFDVSFQSEARIEVGCNMHARRYFVKALDANDVRAAVPIAAFKALYDIESTVKDATPDQRLEARQARSKPVYDELVAWCRQYQPPEPPSSLLAKAIQYLLNHRVALTRFLEDSRLPIDNGLIERIHRGPAVTRRNYLFAGSHAGAERAAIAYSIIATCDLVGVSPVHYLADVMPRLARGVFTSAELAELTPAAWKKARAPAEVATSPPA
jgi:transposase